MIGLGIVLGSILWLRLHPFLALIVGAFFVGGFTGQEYLVEATKSKIYGELLRDAVQAEMASMAERAATGSGVIQTTEQLRADARSSVEFQTEQLSATAEERARQFAAQSSALDRITAAMGSTCQKIGLLIAMACVIGRCLLVSGAAERIVRAALSLVGSRGAPLAFSASSFLLSIPVFFDSMFLLVIPLAKATWLKLRKDYLLLVLALITGGTITHSLVPPTPGPLFVAEELDVNIGTMILVGMAVGLCCTLVGLVFAYWLNSRLEIPVRDSPAALAHLEQLSQRDISELPSLAVSLLPVLLPVALISGATIYGSLLGPTQSLPPTITFLGDKNIALSLSAVLAMLLAASALRDRQALSEQVQQAMQEAGLIILICCAGGAFGATLQQSGIGPYISRMTGSQPLDLGLLPLAFVVTAVIRGAQGSSTVAMFTAVAIVRGLAPDLGALSYHPVYLAVCIGCGSKPFPWMNDSGFWVISRMSGMTEQETLKTHTPMVTLMGFTGFAVTWLAAVVWPLR
jgi:GntP family gluconate:H+ symporter